MKTLLSIVACRDGMRAATLTCLIATIGSNGVATAADANPYPALAPIGQYRMARAEEIALAKSAAPASVAEHAEVLVLGDHGFETAVKGTNGFVCSVGRSWDMGFDNPEFWNPKVRSAMCNNAVAAHSVLPHFLTRAQWVVAGVSKGEIQRREAAAWASGKYKAPEPGAMCYMMAKGARINDAAGHWHPHVMFYLPRTDDAAWGANLPDSPVAADSTNVENTSIFMVIVGNWSDGTPAPVHSH
jgi:hypothetical protein